MVITGYVKRPLGANMTKNKDLNAAIDNLLKTYKTPEEIIGNGSGVGLQDDKMGIHNPFFLSPPLLTN